MGGGSPSGPQLGFLPSFACSAVAACTGELLTIPLDTAKVRLQLQAAGGTPKYRCAPWAAARAASAGARRRGAGLGTPPSGG